MPTKTPASRSVRPTSARTPLLEWLTAAVGLVLLLAVIGVLLADAARTGPDTPPQIVVEKLEAVATPAGWVVEFEARNDSHRAAAEVRVTGVLTTAGAEPERRSATVDYLPGGGSARGGLLFHADPTRGALALAAEGYRQP